MANEICFQTLQFDQPWTLENYLKVGGYQAWKKILAEKTPQEQIIDELKKSCLRGRGGAGSRPDLNGASCRARLDPEIIVCNSDEWSPAHVRIGTSCVITRMP